MSTIDKFNIRVYGLLLNPLNQLLIAHEQINDFKFTKFPGGGLEFGEGLTDCLIREFKEEANIAIQIDQHFYTTDFFQTSAFKQNEQIISVYYWVKTNQNWQQVSLAQHQVKYGVRIENLRFEWVDVNKITPDIFTFPIDKLVCEKINKQQ
ncbi:MAG: NUDIX domain-containing protein [Bacteroidia bacterium]|nr:NUDIX domain-containing protein [Bacteroidia bacterium]MBP9688570.1 NUDIX domain-containing protein [Bacteroidia bacterium]